jgi:probable phosphoglycerate mutase
MNNAAAADHWCDSAEVGKERFMIDWPSALWLVRHGESEGNVANTLARERGALRLELDTNDIEVPLSSTGADQARALGRWFGQLDPDEGPSTVLVSPYVRAQQTRRGRLAGSPGDC